MRTFNDCKGRTWCIAVTVGAVERVRTMADIDLLNPDVLATIEKTIETPVKLCEVVYAIIAPAAQKLGVSDQEFKEAMAGDSLDKAMVGFLFELADFSSNPKERARLNRVVTAILDLTEQANREADQITEKVLTAVGAPLPQGSTSTVSPASLASTPPG